MQTLFLIAKIAGITLVTFGLFHFIVGDKISIMKPWRATYQKWVRIIIVGLTIIVFGIALFYLVLHFIAVFGA